MAEDSGLSVSVVDDDASLRRSLGNLLRSVGGFRVETFDSPSAFLESHSRNPADCVLLDLHMPEMSGLHVLSKLSSSGMLTPVVVFTGHGDEHARRQCLEAGAIAFLQKPCDMDVLLDTVRQAALRSAGSGVPICRARDSLTLASEAAGAHRHIAAFFDGADEGDQVLGSFLKAGLQAGGKAIYIVDGALRGEYRHRLAKAGIDVDRLSASGQLELVPWQKVYLGNDRFEPDAILQFAEGFYQALAASGYPSTRVVAHMEWALLDKPGVEKLLEYEARANYLQTEYDAPVVCAYDLNRFSASSVVDIMRAHPMVIIGGVLHQNPYYVPPDEYLREIQCRRLTGTRHRHGRHSPSPDSGSSTVAALANLIAHEANQPLAAIVANAEALLSWLANDSPDPETLRETLLDIVAESHRTAHAIQLIRGLVQDGRASLA